MKIIQKLYEDKDDWVIPALAPIFKVLVFLMGNPLNEKKYRKEYLKEKQRREERTQKLLKEVQELEMEIYGKIITQN